MTDMIDDALATQLEAAGIPRGSYDVQPLSRIHKLIAARLTEASRDIPAFPLEMEIRLDALLERRTAFNATEEQRVSVNDLLIRAAALALKQVPAVNASFTAQGIVRHHSADIAVAVATDTDLVTPIVRAADSRHVRDIAAAMKDYVARAKIRRLKPDEYNGGTFAISNLGMFGVERFGSIINPPHAAILSVGAARERLMLRDGAVAAVQVMSVTLTCDHRVFDGAAGARWLQAFRNLIEAPEPLFA